MGQSLGKRLLRIRVVDAQGAGIESRPRGRSLRRVERVVLPRRRGAAAGCGHLRAWLRDRGGDARRLAGNGLAAGVQPSHALVAARPRRRRVRGARRREHASRARARRAHGAAISRSPACWALLAGATSAAASVRAVRASDPRSPGRSAGTALGERVRICPEVVRRAKRLAPGPHAVHRGDDLDASGRSGAAVDAPRRHRARDLARGEAAGSHLSAARARLRHRHRVALGCQHAVAGRPTSGRIASPPAWAARRTRPASRPAVPSRRRPPTCAPWWSWRSYVPMIMPLAIARASSTSINLSRPGESGTASSPPSAKHLERVAVLAVRGRRVGRQPAVLQVGVGAQRPPTRACPRRRPARRRAGRRS